MQLPNKLIESLYDLPGFDAASFINVHNSGEQVTAIRLNPFKINIDSYQTSNPELQTSNSLVPWSQYGFYLQQRPSFTFDPLFHAGCYYVQEASSMFIEQALLQTTAISQSLKILDLCAAPGGKSTHLQSLISKDSLLVSNEVIKSRANILKENIIKWGVNNVLVTNNDPQDFAALPGYFDVILIDAPCSGSGLFRKDVTAIDEWSENNVNICNKRQQRILADALPALKENGILIYATCSYSMQEDEAILEWLVTEFDMESLPIQTAADWHITTVEKNNTFGYRFWPYQVKGEGFFLTVLRKKYVQEKPEKYKQKIKPLSKNEIGPLHQWLQTDGLRFVSFGGKIYAWPENLFDVFEQLAHHLRVIYSGTLIGEQAREKLIPDHALAMSTLIADDILKTELNLTDAIAYLQKKELPGMPEQKGWQLATCKGQGLGWMNVLLNRINNYYPKELRIRKDEI